MKELDYKSNLFYVRNGCLTSNSIHMKVPLYYCLGEIFNYPENKSVKYVHAIKYVPGKIGEIEAVAVHRLAPYFNVTTRSSVPNDLSDSWVNAARNKWMNFSKISA